MTTKIVTEVEICCGDIESLYQAAQGGARRVELCNALSEGGVTPSFSMIKTAVSLGFDSINVLVRPRMGDFVYSDEEIAAMVEDIHFAKEIGATGIVSGALLDNGSIDIDNTQKLMNAAKGVEFVFHRAFDRTANPTEALEVLTGMGCNRILTSGCQANAIAGAAMLRQLVAAANGQITIMAGAGITPDNVAELIEKTGVVAVHSTAKTTVNSLSVFRNENVNMGAVGADEYTRSVTSSEIVAKLIENANLQP